MNRGIFGLPGGSGAPTTKPKPWEFESYSHNWPTTPNITAPGTSVTTLGASPNTDATPALAIAALTHDVHLLRIRIHGTAVVGAATNTLGTILVDPSGGSNWSTLISGLPGGFKSASAAQNAALYEFPVFIRSGTSIGFTARTEYTTDRATIALIEALGDPTDPAAWWCGEAVEVLGANPATSKGTDFTPANGSFSTLETIGVSTRRYGSVTYGVQPPDNDNANLSYYFKLGTNGTNFGVQSAANIQTTEQILNLGTYSQPCDKPAGTIWQITSRCSGAAEVLNAVVLGVY